MNLTEFAGMFYAATYLPLACYRDDTFVQSFGFYHDNDPYPFVIHRLMEKDSPSIYVSSDGGYYGLVRHETQYIILGPCYSTPVSDKDILNYMRKNTVSNDSKNEISEFLWGIPPYSMNRFINVLILIHYLLNNETLDITRISNVTDTQINEVISRKQASEQYNARDNEVLHGTYMFERQLLHIVQQGNTEKLKNFLLEAMKQVPMSEGKLADNALRQAKNLFIGIVAMIGKEAAIPAGLDIEETYQIIDTYTQECERLQSEEDVKNLQYNMLLDFTSRINRHKRPHKISSEVQACCDYISTHINEPINTDDVARFIGMSRSYIMQKFKIELGRSVADTIMDYRIEEAKTLLSYTDKPLAEISEYLCFSSQAYFQNVFKKRFNITPGSYRKGR